MLRYWRKCSCALILAELLNCVLAPKTSMQLCAPQVVALHSHTGRRCSYASHAQESGGWCGGGGAGGGGRSIPCHAEVTFSVRNILFHCNFFLRYILFQCNFLFRKHFVAMQFFLPDATKGPFRATFGPLCCNTAPLGGKKEPLCCNAFFVVAVQLFVPRPSVAVYLASHNSASKCRAGNRDRRSTHPFEETTAILQSEQKPC